MLLLNGTKSSEAAENNSHSHHAENIDGEGNSDQINGKIDNSSNNPAKHNEWSDLGLPLAGVGSYWDWGNKSVEIDAIERNACMLEDLLATALEYDARLAEEGEADCKSNTAMGGEMNDWSERSDDAHDVQGSDGQQDCQSPNGTATRSRRKRTTPPSLSSTFKTDNTTLRGAMNDWTERSGDSQQVQGSSSPQTFTSTRSSRKRIIPSSLSPTLRSQIRGYVTQIASRYHHVGFHSFEHASHVMLSATKICYMLQEHSPLYSIMHEGEGDTADANNEDDRPKETGSEQLPNLCGTIYDPWLHFAICLSALLHDVDHKGIPNNELLAERDLLAVKYGGDECMKSYAEWNSLDIGLSLLRGSVEYGEFDAALGGVDGSDREKKERFYDMVTDLILCTDIASKERREMGMQKWERACSGVAGEAIIAPDASGVLSEQIMQVADVSHTMQHFSTFAKWNGHLYHEILAAYQCGRTKCFGNEIRHPKENWYESQIGFYDHYIIPLAERLDASGAFCEHHKFAPLAVRNKEEWIEKGKECTRLMVMEASAVELLPPIPVTPYVSKKKMRQISEVTNSTQSSQVEGEDDEGEGEDSLNKSTMTLLSESARSTATLVSGRPAHHKQEGFIEEESILNEVDITQRGPHAIDMSERGRAIIEGEDMMFEDEEDLQSSISDLLSRASSRVSFRGLDASSRASSQSAKYYASRRTAASQISIVDSSVNALVPQMLCRQLVHSIQTDIARSSSTPQESIARYQSSGSIKRHRGALLFVDISGFTTLSQNYPVEDFKTFINRYFTMLIDLVVLFGGEVVKFAGDALYAVWGSTGEKEEGIAQQHDINIERCTACAIAINAACNNYRVSKSYNTRRLSDMDQSDNSHTSGQEGRGQGEVLYRLQDKNAKYEERGAVLNVYCGVSEGIMAGVDVVASNRAEFFLVGKPLKDVAKAESLAGPGELVVSPSVYDSLHKGEAKSIASELVFSNVEDDYRRVSWPQCPSVDDMLLHFNDAPRKKTDAQSLISELVSNMSDCESMTSPGEADCVADSLQSDLVRLFEYHRHEAARDVVGKFTAELRRVVVLFISLDYEPSLSPNDSSEDSAILDTFQSIYSIITESISSRSGQVRQFINDDKGTVFIASFGLRGSVVLQPADTAVDAAKEVQRKLLSILDVQSSIGITVGKIFCGETGSFQRYEYSLLGSSVNLSARLMAKGAWGQINCDEKLVNNTGRRHTFTISETHKLKGYDTPVPFYTPISQDNIEKEGEQGDDIVSFFMKKHEVLGLVDNILLQCPENNPTKPRMILIRGNQGNGRDEFITSILKQSSLCNTSIILEANRCFHDDPFYCVIPIVTRILLSYMELRERILDLKKLRKRSSVLASLLTSDALQSQAFPRGTDIVPDKLRPYLSLVNDFVFKGFPFLKSSPEAKRLKDAEKVNKCIEVLSALVVRFLDLKERPGIISICEIDCMDSYSRKLLGRILKSETNLLVIGGADDASLPVLEDAEPLSSSFQDITTAAIMADSNSFLTSILGEECDTVEMKIMNLGLLDKKSNFDLFRWSLRSDLSHEDCDNIDVPDIHDKIYELSGGMTHSTTQLAHTFSTQFQKERISQNNEAIYSLPYLRTFLNDTPTSFDEIICFRIDQMKPEEQMLLKIASVAGFSNYSFTQNLLETVLLALSMSDDNNNDKDDDLWDEEVGQVPLSVGVDSDVPMSIGISDNEKKFNYMFQGEYFQQTLESLVAHKFIDEVNVEMGDLGSMDSVMYRFRNNHEQSVINGLMLNDQKQRTHFEVAVFYSSMFRGGGESTSLDESDYSSLSTDITSIPTTDWELFHIIALHYDLANVPLPAMLHYFDSSASLASLGMRDKAHGRLLSAYLMLEKILHHASTLDVQIDEGVEQRRQIAQQMVRTIGIEELKDSMKMLTKEHLRLAFGSDIFAFKKSLIMLTKFGQSVGTIEEEGYLFGSELYLLAIQLVLLVLKDEAFNNLTSSLGSFLGQLDIESMKRREIKEEEDGSINSSEDVNSEDSCFDDSFHSHGPFDIDDLAVSFPAFSGLLTFYRDSPIGANQMQETFLANLFVAVTQEANQMIHVLRTKCILSHLYLKHGNIVKALEECEGIKDIYDHDRHSLELVNIYGMDWPLVCIMTMASTYLYRGQFAAALHNIEFLKTQMLKLDEFASSSKAMSKGNIASFYLLLCEFENAADIASGINATQYGYFFKPIGTLQEELANRELSLHQQRVFDSSARDLDLLSILSADSVHNINHNRGMLDQSAETLSDRGIESVRAALCSTEIRNLELQSKNRTVDVVKKEVQYCQAGLAILKQSLGQKDSNNHERRKNYLMCLHQQAHLLCWHQKLLQLLRDSGGGFQVDDILGIEGNEIALARKSLDECAELSKKYEYPFMQMLAGKSYVKLGLDMSGGEDLIQHALGCMDKEDREFAKVVLSRIDDGMHVFSAHPAPLSAPLSLSKREVPSAA